MQNFVSHNPLKAIGVHCTHGFNRTGFLLVAYAVEVMDWSLEAAVKEFANCRSPGIYKQDYIEELFKRYDDVDDVMPAPEKPAWCFEEEEAEDDDESGQAQYTGNGGSSLRKRDRPAKKNPAFMEGVGGVTSVTTQPLLQEIQWKFQDFCHWQSTGFPGCQPVSMDVRNIAKLRKPYMVSWKADGTRYMMLILGRDKVYFADRDHCIFKVDGMTFPHRADIKRHLIDTVMDGEMVIDRVFETNKMTGMKEEQMIPRYLIYDIITCDGKDVSQLPFRKRYDLIESEVIKPRHNAIVQGMIRRHEEPFGVRRKDFCDVHQAKSFLSEKFKKQLSHEPDGLIFQPREDPYIAGRCDDVLKWKPETHNSVDFKLKIVVEDGQGMVRKKVGHLYCGGLSQPYGTIKVSKAVRELDNKIIECRLNNNQWELMRERTDKSFPNGYATVIGVMNSITNPVTKDMLLNYIDEHCPRAIPPANANRSHHEAMKRPAPSGSGNSDQSLMPPPPKFSR